MVKFAAISDLHFGKEGAAERGKHLIERIRKVNGLEAVLLVGDLTNSKKKGWLKCCGISQTPDSSEHFEHGFLYSLEENVAPAFLCAGNHDIRDGESPVVDLIKNRYHDTVYSFDIRDVHFVCCHLYPDTTRLQRLVSDLDRLELINVPADDTPSALASDGPDPSGEAIEAALTVQHPVVIFFHYNLEGQHSDWWSEKEKEAFYQAIRPAADKKYQVCCVAVGHQHRSYVEKWRDITVVSGAGDDPIVCEYRPGSEFEAELVL